MRGEKMDDIKEKLIYSEFYCRENELRHIPVEKEMKFYDSVKRGDVREVEKMLTPLGGEGFGVLSADSLMNLKFHFVITVAFMTRYCIEGGMEHETAYNLSDVYIRQADKARDEKSVRLLHENAVLDFTGRMARLHRSSRYPKPIIQAFEYIYLNLNRNIGTSDIAAHLGLSSPYLSRLFRSETGMTVREYIRKKRIETAQRMLIYSEYEPSYIGASLAFSSQSHFIKCFREETGLTPKQYRDNYYRANIAGME